MEKLKKSHHKELDLLAQLSQSSTHLYAERNNAQNLNNSQSTLKRHLMAQKQTIKYLTTKSGKLMSRNILKHKMCFCKMLNTV